MDDHTHQILRLRGLLEAAQEVIDALAGESPPAPDQRSIIAAAAVAVADAMPRTRKDIARFVEAFTAGDEGWLLVRSVPGEHRIDALYAAKLPAEVRRMTGL